MSLASKVLNKPISAGKIKVLPFINYNKYTDDKENASEEITYVKEGDFLEINTSKIALNYYCKICEDKRTFMSSDKLHCLIIRNDLISIDAFLSCPSCSTLIQVWILLEVEGMFSEEPKVKIIKRIDKLHENVTELSIQDFGEYTEFLEKALRASRDGYGAGSIIYLRKVFEKITTLAANESGISLTFHPKGDTSRIKNKTFKDLLEEVDASTKIIPTEFSDNGYNLFRKLSDVVHGEYNEDVALDKFTGFYRLIIGVIENMKNKKEFKSALNQIGILTGGETGE